MAQILRQTFPIVAHEIRKTLIDEGNQKAAIKKIQKDNSRLHPGLEIIQVKWLAFIARPYLDKSIKIYSFLVIETASPESANRLITKEIIADYNLIFYNRWKHNGEIKQCFNYHEYDHILIRYKQLIRCERYSDSYTTYNYGEIQIKGEYCPTYEGKHVA